MPLEPKSIQLAKVAPPLPETNLVPITLTDETMEVRFERVLKTMKAEGYSTLVIYEDLEHGSNFEYLTGFLTRFEEALLIIHDDGTVYYVLGNENLKLEKHARLKGKVIHAPQFSLPNQPRFEDKPLTEILDQTLFKVDGQIGLVGWKLFTGTHAESKKNFDLPHYIVETITKQIGSDKVFNATDLFIGDQGVRTTNTANEIAHYEFGAALASASILKTLDAVEIGKTEMELGQILNASGQPNSVVTIAATGKRFEKARLYPGHKKIALGDPVSLTVGYKGGLQSRSAFAVHDATELPKGQEQYLEKVVYPYFKAISTWLENVHIGMEGKEVYKLIETVLPKKQYGWHLNPGHYVADEEWMASPIYKDSTVTLKSGMLFQVDIIPSIEGFSGTSAEGGIVLADEMLKEQIKSNYPEIWDRMIKRRTFIMDQLGIDLHEDILPLGNALPYLRPFLLDKEKAVTISKKV
ncbi:Xaa-Pro peptidase family protein [Marinilactibacillus sp. Marseille-P9653]|uniref:M24 family metallopeptidase n=1 Tax=Marinilactibacillus sp. Marseille-P9653 TaxID=2866583 RepID=UPI001CE43195|nr:M24 family metallopeptidase [Marinilactibacillus sp. Marseille-P9653]